jgi:hypothetical protein
VWHPSRGAGRRNWRDVCWRVGDDSRVCKVRGKCFILVFTLRVSQTAVLIQGDLGVRRRDRGVVRSGAGGRAVVGEVKLRSGTLHGMGDNNVGNEGLDLVGWDDDPDGRECSALRFHPSVHVVGEGTLPCPMTVVAEALAALVLADSELETSRVHVPKCSGCPLLAVWVGVSLVLHRRRWQWGLLCQPGGGRVLTLRRRPPHLHRERRRRHLALLLIRPRVTYSREHVLVGSVMSDCRLDEHRVWVGKPLDEEVPEHGV